MNMRLAFLFDKLNKTSLYLLLALIPIFFLPFTQNVLDFPKQLLFSILILLSLIGLLGKKMLEGELLLRENKIFYFSLVLISLSLLFSCIFSIWPKVSFLGSPSDVVDNFLVYILLLVLLFLVVNSFEKEIDFFPFFFLFLLSGAIAGFFNLFQIYKIFPLLFDFTKTQSFNTIGTANSLALFSAALLPLSLILTFWGKKFLKIILGIITSLFFINVVLINSKIAWLSLIISIFILFIFGFENQKEKLKIGWTAFLMVGLILSIFLYFFPIHLPGFPVLPPEISLSLNSEIYILKGAFSEGVKNIILGTGPGTFIFDYSQYRSPLLNQTIFWGTRFSNGHSLFTDWLLTKGLLGGASLLFFYILLASFIFKRLKQKGEFFEIRLGLSAGVLSLIFVSFFYSFSLTLYFTLFVLIGGFVLFSSKEITKIGLSPSRAIFVNSIFILTIILSLSLFFLQGQRYLAEIKYLKGVKNFQTGNLEQAINHLQGAAKLNSSVDIYWRDISQIYLAKVNLISQDPRLSAEDKRRLANLAIVSGAETINQAIETAPFNVANWNVRGFFYRSLIGIEGAGNLALSSYKKAIQLEPSSPFAYGEKGRVHILLAQDFAQKKEDELKEQNLDIALEDLKRALELKPDYAPAHYLLAVVYDQKGNIGQAISKLEETTIITPQDVGVAFQLGLLYWRKAETERAQAEFEKVLALVPNYSNARYMLGLVYDKKGEKKRAKEEFKKVADLNPENQQIKKILENLGKGLPALEGIISEQPPIQETPSEIQR